MKNYITSLLLKIFIILIATIYKSYYLSAQDNTWLKDVTKSVGLDSAYGTKVLLVDINNDNYPDLLWGTGNLNKNRYKLYLNIPNPDQKSEFKRIFKDITELSNINQNRDPEKQGRIIDIASMADLDNDGDLDLATSIYYHRLQMYQGADDPGDRPEVMLNDGNGRFTLVQNSGLTDLRLVDTLPPGLLNSTGMSFLDYDYDGKIDLYISNWFSDYAANLANNYTGYIMPDALLKGNGDGTFTFVPNSGIEKVVMPMYGVNVTDWNNDGWQDIITSPYCRSGGSLFQNLKNGKFLDASGQANYNAQEMAGDHQQALCQWEAQPADFDKDGDMDLLQVDVHGGNDPNEGRTHISINKGPNDNFRFLWDNDRLRRDAPKPSTHFGDQGGTWIDIDGDSRLDVAVANMGYIDVQNNINTQGQVRLYVLRQNDSGYFDDVTKPLGLYETMKDGHSMEPTDFDLDGDMDLFFSHLVRDTVMENNVPKITEHMQIVLLRNDIGNKNYWTSVKLIPPNDCNRSAIGARITVYCDTMAQIREVQAGLGHFAGQQHFFQNFGLARKQIDSIVVRWPDKDLKVTTITNPPVNTILIIDGNGSAGFVKPWDGQKPIVQFIKSYLRFPRTDAGSSSAIPLEVKNVGDADMVLKSVKSNNPEIFKAEALNLPVIVSPGESVVLEVSFHPVAREYYSTTIDIETDAVNGPNSVLEARGDGYEPKPLISLSKNEILFDSVWVDSTNVKKIVVKNVGEVDLIVSDISFSSGTPAVFSLKPVSLPLNIKPGDSVNVDLIFHPDSRSDFSGELDIESNGYKAASSRVLLRGVCNGPTPQLELSRSALFFSFVDIGNYKELDLELSNSGTANLDITDILVKKDLDKAYSFPGLSLPLTIAPGQKQVMNVRFEPKEAKKYNYTLTIISNDFDENEKEISIKGTGQQPSAVNDGLPLYLKEIEVYPQPARETATLNFAIDSDLQGMINIRLCNMLGQDVAEFQRSRYAPGNYQMEIDITDLRPGLYYLVFESDLYVEYYPIVKD